MQYCPALFSKSTTWRSLSYLHERKKRQGMTWCVVRDEVESRSGLWSEISQSAVGVCPSGGSANGGRSTTCLLGCLDVETCPSLRTSVQPASTAFCEKLSPAWSAGATTSGTRLDSVLQDASSGGFEYPYPILYCCSIDKVL